MLPSLCLPSKEDSGLEPVLADRGKQQAGLGRTARQPHSARQPRDGRQESNLLLHEDTVRAVYKKHAQNFFEDIKEGFLKEATALRKHTQKVLAKTAAVSVVDAEGCGAPGGAPTPAAAAIAQDQVAALQRQVADLQAAVAALQSRSEGLFGSGKHCRDNRAESSPGADSKVSKVSLECRDPATAFTARLDKQQEELKTLSRHVHSEFAFAKKATLTPMWKERALQEIAQGELRAVCAQEVSKACQELAERSDDRQVELALLRLGESGAMPWETRLQTEFRGLYDHLEQQIGELSCRADESTHARAVLVERCDAIEQNQGITEGRVEKLRLEIHAVRANDIAGLSGRISGLDARSNALDDHCGSLDRQLAATNDTCEGLDKSLAAAKAQGESLERQIAGLAGRCDKADAHLRDRYDELCTGLAKERFERGMDIARLDATVSGLNQRMEVVEVAAAGARDAAKCAQATADKAGEAADRAQATADNAGEAASRAQATADNAGEAASCAQASASQAGDAAHGAQATADAASAAAGSAQASAVAAGEAARTAQVTANMADEAANSAQAAARKAGEAATRTQVAAEARAATERSNAASQGAAIEATMREAAAARESADLARVKASAACDTARQAQKEAAAAGDAAKSAWEEAAAANGTSKLARNEAERSRSAVTGALDTMARHEATTGQHAVQLGTLEGRFDELRRQAERTSTSTDSRVREHADATARHAARLDALDARIHEVGQLADRLQVEVAGVAAREKALSELAAEGPDHADVAARLTAHLEYVGAGLQELRHQASGMNNSIHQHSQRFEALEGSLGECRGDLGRHTSRLDALEDQAGELHRQAKDLGAELGNKLSVHAQHLDTVSVQNSKRFEALEDRIGELHRRAEGISRAVYANSDDMGAHLRDIVASMEEHTNAVEAKLQTQVRHNRARIDILEGQLNERAGDQDGAPEAQMSRALPDDGTLERVMAEIQANVAKECRAPSGSSMEDAMVAQSEVSNAMRVALASLDDAPSTPNTPDCDEEVEIHGGRIRQDDLRIRPGAVIASIRTSSLAGDPEESSAASVSRSTSTDIEN